MVFDRHRIGCRIPDEYHLVLGSGKPCVDEIPLEHHEVLLEDWEDDDGILAALALVYGDRIGQVGGPSLPFFVHDPAVIEKNLHFAVH